ncbi:MAG: replicative DNA helicase [Zetaproteobacteria bacterium]|nr:MAG: replicative DNA helicase [Zetaproteobacteria bacterium]
MPGGLRERVPPQALDAERAVLGAIFLDAQQALERIEGFLHPEDFYAEAHQRIYRAALTLHEKGRAVDALTVKEFLAQNGELERVGGEAYLASLLAVVPTAANVEHYARIVRDRAVLRELLRTCHKITEGVYEEPELDVHEHLDRAEQKILRIAERYGQGLERFSSMQGLMRQVYEQLAERYEKKSLITGVPTGFTDLDTMTSGLQRGDLIIIAGRPSMGKTAFAMNIATNVALRGDSEAVVAVFSLEMADSQLALRMLASEARVDLKKLRTGHFSSDDWMKLANTTGKLAEAKIFIDDTPNLGVLDVRAKCRRLKREHGRLDLIVIDYLQLMTGRADAERREQEISEITRGLKGLAKELHVPVVALSQLNRSVEQRADKRPIMADLRESGAIEQDADLILAVFREEVYHPKPENEGLAEIIVLKQRNGPTGTVKLTFIKPYTRFENHAPSAAFDA